MALLLETTLGDLVIDLDVEGSPELCKNVLKLAKARYYTSTLVYNVQVNRFCQLGDPQGDGSGGACIHGLISSLLNDGELRNERVLKSQQRFLNSNMGRRLTPEECQEKGRVVATEMKGIPDTIGSQLLITTCSGKDVALDGFKTNENGDDRQSFRSVGIVREDDNNVLDQIAAAYCDADGRPFADIRIIRAHVVDDPFDDPPGMDRLLKERGVEIDSENRVCMSPDYERPPEEKVEIRIQADQVDSLTGEEDIEKIREQEEELLKREDRSRAVVLEMLGDLPDADLTAPENVLFVCKLNPVTEDEDLELIFSRFDEKVKAEIIRDQDTGASLQYAFVEFSSKEQAAEAYFKMNNALVDDRRIKVDFSQSVAKVWNKFSQRMRNSTGQRSNRHMPRDPFSDSHSRPQGVGPMGGAGLVGRGTGVSQRRDQDNRRNRPPSHQQHNDERGHARGDLLPVHDDRMDAKPREEYDDFGRRRPSQRPYDAPSDHRSRREPERDQERDHRHHHDVDRRQKGSRDSENEGARDRKHVRKRARSRSNDRKSRKRSHDNQKRSRDDPSEESSSRDSETQLETKGDGHRHRRRRERHERSRERKKDQSEDRDQKRHRKRDRSDDKKRRHRDDGRDHRRRSEY